MTKKKTKKSSAASKAAASGNKIDNKQFALYRIGLTKLLEPELERPLEIGHIYMVSLCTDRKGYETLCNEPSLLNGKTIGDLLEREPLFASLRMSDAVNPISFDIDFNQHNFGLEFSNTSNHDCGIYKRVDDDEYINLLTDKTRYIDLYRYNKNDSRYAPLNSLPAELRHWCNSNGCLHGKLVLDYALDEPYEVDLDFSTTNDVLTEIKRAYIKMHDTKAKDLFSEMSGHSIIFLKVEILRFNPKTGDFRVFIGS